MKPTENSLGEKFAIVPIHARRRRDTRGQRDKRKVPEKSIIMNVPSCGFIGFGDETANLFNTCRAQGENNPPIYCQYLQGMLAILNIHTCRDQKPYIQGSLPPTPFAAPKTFAKRKPKARWKGADAMAFQYKRSDFAHRAGQTETEPLKQPLN